MSDLISRQAAINVVKGIDSHFVKYIEALPSARPELTEEEKILLKKLRSYYGGSYAKLIDKLVAIASAQPELSEDAVKDYCRKRCWIIVTSEFYDEVMKRWSSAQPEQRWIPCSERLPEDGTYIVYAPDYRGGSSSAKEWHDGIMFSKIKNGRWSVEHGYYKRPGCVVAWMPLPEPAKIGE